MQLRPALSAGQIDATAWNEDDFALHPDSNFRIVPAHEAGFEDLSATYSEAVIVTRKDRRDLLNLVHAILDFEHLLSVQKEVMALERLPSY